MKNTFRLSSEIQLFIQRIALHEPNTRLPPPGDLWGDALDIACEGFVSMCRPRAIKNSKHQ